jgi:hypothetical protein
VPVLGAVGVAFLVKTFAPEAKGHGVPEVMEAIYWQEAARHHGDDVGAPAARLLITRWSGIEFCT